jgi:hypothetical protein
MTVTFLGEDETGRRATNTKGQRTYERRFKLETSQKSEGPFAVGSHASLPIIGNTHPEDANAFCVSLSVENNNPWKGWTVTANYSDERVLDDDPTQDAAEIAWNSEQFQKVAVVDRSGNVICNSAGDLFDPPAMIDDSRRVVTVTKNLAVVPTWILDYQDAVNSDSFTVDGVSIAVGKAKMQAVTVGPKQRRNATVFRTVTFTMHLQRDGWALDILDAGFNRKDPADATKRIPITIDGVLPSAPYPLNGSGVPLENPSPSTGVFLSYNVYKTRAFSSLPLT